MKFSDSFLDEIRARLPVSQVVSRRVPLKRAGREWKGLSPFNKEKTPSFTVNPKRGIFHCFGCGVSGDVFSFVQKIENITFPEAVRLVAQKLGMEAPKAQFTSPEEAREARTRGLLLDLHETACQWFQQQLKRPEAAAAREYLRGRGLDGRRVHARPRRPVRPGNPRANRRPSARAVAAPR